MANPINLEALRALDAIQQTGSFASAAELLFKVPSALTYTIQKLEQGLGVDLFDRSGQRSRLTPAGELVLEQGRELLLAAEQLKEAVKQLDTGWEPRLALAWDTVLPMQPIFELIREFQKLNRQTDIALYEEVLSGGWEALQTGRAHIAIGASGELPKGDFKVQALGDIDFAFAVAPDHPLTQIDKPLTSKDIRQYTSVIVADSSQLMAGRSSGLLDTHRRLRVNSMAAKVEAQKAGIGVGFLPLHCIQTELAMGSLVCLPCEIPREKETLFIAWRRQPGKALEWFTQGLMDLNWPSIFSA